MFSFVITKMHAWWWIIQKSKLIKIPKKLIAEPITDYWGENATKYSQNAFRGQILGRYA